MSNPFINWPLGTAKDDSVQVPCWNCGGTGVVDILVGFEDDDSEAPCPKCEGTGSQHMVRVRINFVPPPEPDVIV